MASKVLEKSYDPHQVEEKWYRVWEERGYFRADENSEQNPYSIVIPPPNVTGVLHIGHALNNTLQDILIRIKKMQGYNVLWMPGTDHAGIATQNVVEKQLLEEGLDRHTLGREKFIERVWKWKEQSGGTIIGQLKKLGASCDWSRERFTLDAMKELEKVRHFIYSCRKCGVCRYKMTGKLPYVCPVKQASPGFENFSSRGKIMLAQALLEGQIEPSAGLSRAAYSCTMCGNCMTQCGATDPNTNSPLVDNPAIVEALRADILREHPEYIAETYHRALAATRQFGNPWGMPRSARGKWAKGLKIKDAQKEQADVLLFAGCTMSLNPELTPRIKKAVAVLRKAGADLGILGAAEPCCGSVQQRIGDMEEREEARRLLKAVGDMMRDNMAPDATHPKHVCDFIYCPEIATCMVCENWTDALVMCYPDDFQDEEETK